MKANDMRNYILENKKKLLKNLFQEKLLLNI